MAVHDINRDAVAELELLQAKGVASVAEATRDSEIVVTMLPNSAVVEEIVAGDGRHSEQCQAGHADHGHEHRQPGDSRMLLPRRRKRRAWPSSMRRSGASPRMPIAASHCSWWARRASDFERVKPLLEAMGNTIYHCGPVGSGIRTKLVNNLLGGGVLPAQCRGTGACRSASVSIFERTLDVLYGTTAVNGQLKVNWPNKVLKGDTVPGFSIDLAHKDLSLIVDAANSARVPMPMVAAAREAFSAARASGFGGQDFSAMVDVAVRLGRHREASPQELTDNNERQRI